MIIRNASIEQIEKALELVNREFDNNIVIKKLELPRVRLGVRNTSKIGTRIGHSGRKIASACWHAHGLFFEKLLEINPNCVIIALGKRIDKNGGNWQDWNIGSIINPLYFSEACNCY